MEGEGLQLESNEAIAEAKPGSIDGPVAEARLAGPVAEALAKGGKSHLSEASLAAEASLFHGGKKLKKTTHKRKGVRRQARATEPRHALL